MKCHGLFHWNVLEVQRSQCKFFVDQRADRFHLLKKKKKKSPNKDFSCHTKDFGIYSVNEG